MKKPTRRGSNIDILRRHASRFPGYALGLQPVDAESIVADIDALTSALMLARGWMLPNDDGSGDDDYRIAVERIHKALKRAGVKL